MKPAAKAYVQIHVCVVLWGFTSILGKVIALPAPALVLWRMLLVAGWLSFVPRVWRGCRGLPVRRLAAYAATGALIAFHWLMFYEAIKLANASVAATCLALAPVFLALVEPLLNRRPFDARELIVGIAVIPGVALVVGGTPTSMRPGYFAGVASALLAAAFNACNKRLIGEGTNAERGRSTIDPLAVTYIEIGVGACVLLLVAPCLPHSGSFLPIPSPKDAALLVVLSALCTLLPFTLALMALEHLSAFSVQLAVNLEPVYAVLLAIVLLGEQKELGVAFYCGGAVVVGAVFAQSWLARGPRAVARDRTA
jgi:drug/metabolite transporter (DMT)-like permease